MSCLRSIPVLFLLLLQASAASAQTPTEALHDAARSGDAPAIERLLAQGVDVNAANEYGATALAFAADRGDVALVKLLIGKGADVNSRDSFYEITPLGWSLYKDHDQVAALLVASGAEGLNELLVAGVRKEKPPLVTLALESGKIDADELAQALVLAQQSGNAEIVTMLESAEAKPVERVESDPSLPEMDDSTKQNAEETPPQKAEAVAAKPVVYERKAGQNWPSFRGPQASGVADGQAAVTEWDVKSGHNVRWKTPIPGLANSSPIVWGDRIFVTTAISGAGDDTFRSGLYGDTDSVDDTSEHTFKVYALARDTGEVVWEKTAATSVPGAKRHLKSTQANSTPVTDGKHVVALFGTLGLLVCYDMDGNETWRADLGVLDAGWFYDETYQWGHASSPVIHDGLVIVQADVDGDSFLAAWKLADGKQAWRTARDEIPTWGSPTVHGNELITNGTTIRGYDATNGKPLWQLGPNSEVTVATPIVAHGLIYVTGGYAPVRPIYAIRLGAKGELTLPEGRDSSDSIAWSKERGGTYMPTPIVYGEQLYTCNNDGRMTSYDAKTGERIYRARVGGGGTFSASPVASDGKLYFATEEGDVIVIRAGGAYEELARNEMGEVIMSTPAISDGLVVVRTIKHVYGLGAPETPQED